MARIVDYRDQGAWLQPLGAMDLHPEPASVAQARRWFRRLTAGLPLLRPVDDCTLMLSELVTNAITHGSAEGNWRIRVEWWRVGEALHVAVHNPGTRREAVHVCRPDEDDENGRGLLLVACLADSWEAGPSPFGGTRVSFLLRNALKPPDAEALPSPSRDVPGSHRR